MNNYNPYGNQFQQPTQPQQQTAGTPLMVTLLPDISLADSYNIAPNSSIFFLDQVMTTLKMRSRDQSGFIRPDRIWEIKETTPPPQTPAQALNMMLQTGRINQETYNMFKGMV